MSQKQEEGEKVVRTGEKKGKITNFIKKLARKVKKRVRERRGSFLLLFSEKEEEEGEELYMMGEGRLDNK